MDDAGAEGLGLRRRVVRSAIGPVVVHAAEHDRGSGVLLIHGAAGSWTTWLPMLQTAARRGGPLPGAVAPDLPGWGASPGPSRPLSAEDAARVVATAADACGLERWVVVGHSLGGFVALELAALEPERTAGVVLVSPTGPAVVDAIRRPVRGGAHLPWFAGMLVAMRVLAALPGQGRGLLRRLRRAMPALSAPLFHDRRAVDPAVPEALADEIRPRAFLRAARAATRTDLTRWSAVTCPVRSVRGAHDVFAGARDAAGLAALLPDFAERVLPDAGHFAHAERPEAVLDAIAEVAGAGDTGRIW